jgi:hypothetical protein
MGEAGKDSVNAIDVLICIFEHLWQSKIITLFLIVTFLM